MPRLDRGLYEVLITEALAAGLRELGERLEARSTELRAAEAADRIALHLSRVVRRAIAAIEDDTRVASSIELARKLIQHIDASIENSHAAPDAPIAPGRALRAISARHPDGSPERIPEPLIPLLDTTLLTNAPGEPSVGTQIRTEVHSADRIDVVMAFIRRSGITPLLEALRAYCANGRPLRVLTTTYTGSTEASALDAIQELGGKVRVSYDTSTTRLHAKAWLFHRRSGFSTAYVGSSNLTHSAQVSGLEWNVRVAGARNPDVVDKLAAVFEAYWNSGDFVHYERDEFLARTHEATHPTQAVFLSPLEVRLEPFQERLLEQIALSRESGHHRNLLASATGTGKTVMAAIDYARLRQALPRARLLFVAHREEILDQSLATFRVALRDHAFGELWVGGQRPRDFEHVFASIQSLNASGLSGIDPTHFDIVIIDEFHHAAARSYQALLDRLRPVELLGLTATPERSDGLPVLGWFDNRIAAELRLWDAIAQHRLSPFTYYGIHDGLDLREIPWQRGRGYDTEGLSNLLTATDAWAKLVLSQLASRVDDAHRMRALGFCVSVEHARYMARIFREAGVPATAVWADSPDEERRAALSDLAARRVNAVFSVDLFNEGVDVPNVDTLLLLRPTDSPTLFLQQLGRGLRRSPGKTVCTVLDFVGRHRTEFRFERRFRSLLGGSRKDLIEQIEAGFPFLPAGCHMELDRVAADIVLGNIRDAVPSRWTAKVEELRLIARGDASVSLARFLDETGLDLDDVYTGQKSWSDLRSDAGLPVAPAGPLEEALRRACGRMLHVDDADRIEAYLGFLAGAEAPRPAALSVRERRLLRMLVASVVDRAVTKTTSLEDGCALLWAHPQVRLDLGQLLEVLASRLQHLPHALATHPDVPLQVHARYSRIETLAAFGVGEGAKVAPWQTGVYWAREAGADLLAFTLDKTSGQFSPTTRYRDYAISRELIHWESQSTTRATARPASATSSISNAAPASCSLRAFAVTTGPSPSSGQPITSATNPSCRWRSPGDCIHRLPGDLFAAFAAAVA